MDKTLKVSLGTRKDWDELNHKARNLEFKIEKKIDDLSKIDPVSSKNDSLQEPLISPDQKYDESCAELNQLFNELNTVDENLNDLCNNEQTSVTDSHLLDRHWALLRDYQKQFSKLKKQYDDRKDREKLFHKNNIDIESYKSGLNRRMDFYIKENEHARSSERLIDEQISIAMETREHLNNQRVVMKKVRTMMNDMSNKFPVINSLIQRIHIKKRKDSLIVAATISFCIVLLLIYIFW